MPGVSCPNCGSILRKRGLNSLENIRRRDIDNVHDRYVCESCETTFSEAEIVDEDRTNLNMKDWMQS